MICVYIRYNRTPTPFSPPGPSQTPGKPILKWKGMIRAFQRRAGRLQRPTTASCRSSGADYWGAIRCRSYPCRHGWEAGAHQPGLRAGTSTSFQYRMVTSSDLRGAVGGLWRRPARRWKALIMLFHLSVGFPGICAGSSGVNGAGERDQRIHTHLNSSLKNNAIYIYIYIYISMKLFLDINIYIYTHIFLYQEKGLTLKIT